MPRVLVRGTPIEYRVLKTRRNRYMRLTVSARGGVRISAPYGTPDRDLHAMVLEKGAWILDRIEHFRRQEEALPRWRYHDGAQVLLRGRWTTLHVRPWNRNAGSIRLTEDGILIQVPSAMCTDEAVLRDLFERWLRRWARQDLPLRLDTLARDMKLHFSRVGIRDQRSKWGSCSVRGSISLNMRLMLTPPEVSDYVIMHELAHIRELNHSPRFWRIVARHCPDYREHQRWLRKHSWLLDMEAQ
ncbi:MAG: SprT family zinc-dependent metalloprotease [Bacteroidota bacterium]|nr:SprT family zinc-dependent metalloprotease [Bacteroidota bacterium]